MQVFPKNCDATLALGQRAVRLLHGALPAVALSLALSMVSVVGALVGGVSMLAIQEFAKRLPILRTDADDDSLYEERIPIALGAGAAIAVVAFNNPISITILTGYATLGALLTMWPRAFHRWRGGQLVAFGDRPEHAHPGVLREAQDGNAG